MKSCAIADDVSDPALRRVERLIAAGVDVIQIRAKSSPADQRLAFAREAVRLVATKGTRIVINSDEQLRADSGAHGLHLPAAAPMPAARSFQLLGRSCHSYDECVVASDLGFDYVFLGPVHAPRSKQGTASIAMSDLRRAASLHVEVFALGGISVDTLAELAGTGVAGIAAITLFFRDEPVEAIVEQIRRL